MASEVVDRSILKMEATMIQFDNQSCIKMTKNPLFHVKKNHIES
jgi:hypothetical protein